jgi:hypothetical protein
MTNTRFIVTNGGEGYSDLDDVFIVNQHLAITYIKSMVDAILTEAEATGQIECWNWECNQMRPYNYDKCPHCGESAVPF